MNVHVSWILFKKTCLSVHVSGPVTCVTLTWTLPKLAKVRKTTNIARAYIFSIFSVQVRKLESTYFGGFRNLNIRVHHLVSHPEKYWSHVYSESIMITQYKNWKARPFWDSYPNPIPITPVTTQHEVDISEIFLIYFIEVIFTQNPLFLASIPIKSYKILIWAKIFVVE